MRQRSGRSRRGTAIGRWPGRPRASPSAMSCWIARPAVLSLTPKRAPSSPAAGTSSRRFPVQIEAATVPTDQGTLPRPASRLGYSPAEVAAIVDKHPNTIYDWLKAGVIKSRRINRAHYIPVAEVRALLDDG